MLHVLTTAATGLGSFNAEKKSCPSRRFSASTYDFLQEAQKKLVWHFGNESACVFVRNFVGDGAFVPNNRLSSYFTAHAVRMLIVHLSCL